MKSYQIWFSTFVYSVIKSLILFLIPLLFFSCKKERDEQPPRVVVEAPYENQTFSTVDTLLVDVQISDNKQLKSLTISLVTDAFEPTGEALSYPISGTSTHLTIDFIIDRPLLDSNPYYLMMQASDGENLSSTFVQIQLHAIAREIERFLTVTKTEFNALVFSGMGFNAPSQQLDVGIDYTGAALNYRQNIFGIVGGDHGAASFYTTTDFSLKSAIPNYGTPSLDYFFGLDYSTEAEHFILLQRLPQYRLLDKYGLPLASQGLQPGYLPTRAFQSGKTIFVEQQVLSSPSRILSNYTPQGLLLNTYTVDGPVRLVSPKDVNANFIWIDSPGGLRLVISDNTDQLLEPIYSREGEELYAAIEVSEGVFLISTATGIYRYSYLSGNTTVLNQNLHPTLLTYEPIDGMIYAVEGNTVHKLTNIGQEIDSYTFANPVVFFGIDYNR